jgi:hypothetical protein
MIEVKMTLERETKGAVRYAEDGDDAKIGTLYLRKSAFPNGKWPDTITVKVSQ